MKRERPRRSVWVRLAQGVSSNLEMIGGLGGFGVSALSSGALEGDHSDRGHEFEEAGWIGLASAAALSLLARLHHPEGQNALPGASGREWQMGVGPKVDEENKLAVLATFKRRF